MTYINLIYEHCAKFHIIRKPAVIVNKAVLLTTKKDRIRHKFIFMSFILLG